MNNEEIEQEELNSEEPKVNKSEEFIKSNKNNLLYGLGALVVIIAGYFAYNQFVLKPKAEEGMAAIRQVQKFYELDSFSLVVNGSAGVPSAIEMADEYAGTKAGDLANYMAGTSYLQLNDFESAIEFLEKVDFNDRLIQYLSKVALGDAYSEKGQYDVAAKLYTDAARNLDGPLAPRVYVKAGLAYEEIGETDKALKIYEEGHEKLKKQPQAEELIVLINRVKAEIETKK